MLADGSINNDFQGKTMQYRDEQGVLITEYVSNEINGGLFRGMAKMIADVFNSRHLIWNLFLRDFNVQFRQQILGYFWAVAGPLLGIVSFVFMAYTGILRPGDSGIPYPLYVFMGTSLWGYMLQAMTSVGGGLQAQSDLIMRTNIPKMALAVSSLSNVIYGLLINCITLGVIMLISGFKPSIWILFYPFLSFPLLIVGTSIGLILSVTGAIAKDLGKIVNQVFTVLMYATPVIYVVNQIEQPLVRKLIILNPLTYLIDVPRSLSCLGETGFWVQYCWASLGAILLFITSIQIFYLLQDLVAERL